MQKAEENGRIEAELKFFGKTVKGLSREEFEEALYRALAGEYTKEEQSKPQSVVWSIPEAEFDELYRKAQNEELKTAGAWEAELARLRKRYGIPEPRPEEAPETEETPPPEGPEEEETPPESDREHETEGTRFEKLRRSLEQTPCAAEWEVLQNGVNQGVRHFLDYRFQYPTRISAIEQRFGLPNGAFNLSVPGFEFFTQKAREVIQKGHCRVVNGKEIYYLPESDDSNQGIAVITKDGKIRTVMPSDWKSFNKLR